MNDRIGLRSEERVRLATQYLKLAQDDLDTARRTRLHYARLGRKYGMTWVEMGAALGMTAGATKMMVRRANKVA